MRVAHEQAWFVVAAKLARMVSEECITEILIVNRMGNDSMDGWLRRRKNDNRRQKSTLSPGDNTCDRKYYLRSCDTTCVGIEPCELRDLNPSRRQLLGQDRRLEVTNDQSLIRS
ncbi:hypothetical protein VTN31DRAFT_6148 [Thermomyces dupontii]|uniref:uncharacterized protein n=1 Tax=Talaromyces thermophilus TaxID=28565 RepID=UPI003742B839